MQTGVQAIVPDAPLLDMYPREKALQRIVLDEFIVSLNIDDKKLIIADVDGLLEI